MAEQATPAAGLYHMVQKDLWISAKRSKQPYFPPTYEQDGFIHLTADPGFLLGIGNHFYRGVPGDFLLLVLDPAKLTAKVVFEPAAPVGNKSSEGLLGEAGSAAGTEGTTATTKEAAGAAEAGPLFPHLYGTIDYDAVQSELAIHRDADGTFVSIPGLLPPTPATAAASDGGVGSGAAV
ncbi:hypothetical protein PLESTB_001744300 [Pleodorina starrii]|uniref:DUF952 domain-containing protein n=1 Tax=Pleodorina starrii TaxID=330485 RepID=A0A9W6C0T3_9CHLO|nr:hypothetical protein PLESTM_001675000 [Pleodorina starrii]GLC61330.1 hypothetical protein PLESTB_001744300 [Pleodorina starrii]GLC69359.1 hypothetical protein PLESTF_000820600 [Pleodorina starrii]